MKALLKENNELKARLKEVEAAKVSCSAFGCMVSFWLMAPTKALASCSSSSSGSCLFSWILIQLLYIYEFLSKLDGVGPVDNRPSTD